MKNNQDIQAHGGARVNAGRKPGTGNKFNEEARRKAAETGQTPLEVMLENMRHFQKVALDAEAVIEAMNEDQVASLGETNEQQFKALLAKVKQAAGLRQMAHDCARDAAPYLHSKLTAVTHSGPDGGPVMFTTVYEQRAG